MTPESSPRLVMYGILGATSVSSLVALVAPVVGAWVWVGFLILAELLMRLVLEGLRGEAFRTPVTCLFFRDLERSGREVEDLVVRTGIEPVLPD